MTDRTRMQDADGVWHDYYRDGPNKPWQLFAETPAPQSKAESERAFDLWYWKQADPQRYHAELIAEAKAAKIAEKAAEWSPDTIEALLAVDKAAREERQADEKSEGRSLPSYPGELSAKDHRLITDVISKKIELQNAPITYEQAEQNMRDLERDGLEKLPTTRRLAELYATDEEPE